MRLFIIAVSSILIMLAVNRAHSDDSNVTSARAVDTTNDIGVGVLVGSASGVTAEYWTGPTDAWSVSILGYGANLGVAFGHNWYMRSIFAADRANYIAPFLGLQAVGVFGEADDFLERQDRSVVYAAQVPVGLHYSPHIRNYGIFAELTPGYEVSPVGYFYLAGDVGARFYF